jgi:tetratricopeptide (TPR) repeat protein
MTDFEKSIEIDPNNESIYVSRGLTKSCVFGQIEQSIKDFDKALELNPSNARAFNLRANAKAHLGLIQEALKDYDRAT